MGRQCRAAWAEDRNIGDPATLKAVLDDAGFDGALLLEKTQDPAVKNQLLLHQPPGQPGPAVPIMVLRAIRGRQLLAEGAQIAAPALTERPQ